MLAALMVMVITNLIGRGIDHPNSGLTRKDCQDKISRMLLVQAGVVKPVLQDYNDMRRYQVLEIELNSGGNVQRLVKVGTNLKIVGKEDIFEELFEMHVSSGHSGRDNMKKTIKLRFANLTQEVLMAFLKTCEFCSTKQAKIPKGIVVKPIVSKEAFSRFQVDYIDLQGTPDETEYGTFKFILHGQDHLTKFTFLEATENKSAKTTVRAIKRMFDIIGPPSILHTDNGREFCNQVSSSYSTSTPFQQLFPTRYLPCIKTNMESR